MFTRNTAKGSLPSGWPAIQPARWGKLRMCLLASCWRVDGETTAVVVDVRTIGIAGASVGDSRAVIVKDGTISELTANQKRKPFIGTGMAEPIGFVCPAPAKHSPPSSSPDHSTGQME